MAGVQEICDRTALATGRGLGELAGDKYRGKARTITLILIAGLIIAADIVAIGSGMNLLHVGPTWLWAVIAGVVITNLITLGKVAQIARVFKFMCLALLTYIGVLFAVHVNWGRVALHTLILHICFAPGFIALLVGVLGTTISPYWFFWQSAHRLEEMRDEAEGGDQPMPLPGEAGAAQSGKNVTAALMSSSG